MEPDGVGGVLKFVRKGVHQHHRQRIRLGAAETSDGGHSDRQACWLRFEQHLDAGGIGERNGTGLADGEPDIADIGLVEIALARHRTRDQSSRADVHGIGRKGQRVAGHLLADQRRLEVRVHREGSVHPGDPEDFRDPVRGSDDREP